MVDKIALAIRLLKLGRPIPITLAVSLLEEGVDVTALERKFAN